MAERIIKSVSCPKCGKINDTPILCSINTKNDAVFRADIFNDSIFRWRCKYCGYSAYMLHPLLYNHTEKRFMVYYIPNVDRRQVVDEELEKDFPELNTVCKRVVPSINAFKEKITILEQGLDDMAIELTKLAVSELVRKSTHADVRDGFFVEIQPNSNNISFQFFIGAEQKSYLQSTKMTVYNRSLEIVHEHFKKDNMRHGFLNIDQRWAKEALQRYRNIH